MLSESESGRLLAQYGYLAIFVGTMLEGETIVLVAGFLAHQGYLSLFWIIFSAIIGSCVSDQGLFFLSRIKGAGFLSKFPKLESQAKKLAGKMHARPVALALFALFFRFFYGLRNIAPVFLGMSDIPTFRFVVLNLLGAVIWATAFSLGGYVFGKAFTHVAGGIAKFEILAIGLIVCGSLIFFAYKRWKKAKPGDGRTGNDG